MFKHLQKLAGPWFIMPDAHYALERLMGALSPSAFFDFAIPKMAPLAYANEQGVARINVHGPMARHADDFEKAFFGIVSMAEVSNAMEAAAADSTVDAVILDFDSPGGTVAGTAELAAHVREMAKRKAVVSYASGMMCSAAYYVGSQANSVLASQSAEVGNVGTVVSFIDYSKAFEAAGLKREVIANEDSPLKGMGSQGVTLTPEQRAFLQDNVNASAEEFKAAVRSTRAVKAGGLHGGWFHGARAQSLGLIDGIATAEQVAAIARSHLAWRR